MKYEIIKGFDIPKNLVPMDDVPIEQMEKFDAIKVDDEANDKNRALWYTRLNTMCKRRKLARPDFKICKRDGKLYIVRVYKTNQ